MSAPARMSDAACRAARSLLAVAALSACAAAGAQTTTFTGSGAVVPTGEPTPPGVLSLYAAGTYEFTGFGTWSLIAGFLFDTTAGTGAGGFIFSQGADSFTGSLASTFAPVAVGPGFEMTYTITSGTGSVAGALGGASSVIRITSDLSVPPPFAYLEAGVISVTLPAVPEPGTALLMLSGAAALWARQRRQASR